MKQSELMPMLVSEDWLGLYAKAYSQRWADGLQTVPPHMWGSVVKWIVFGIIPGGFLQAVIEGDLFQAYARADDTNASAMERWARFFYNYAPSAAYKAGALSSWTGMAFEPEEVSA